MTGDSCQRNGFPAADFESELDLLLSEAKWPEADDETLSRLEAVTASALKERGEILTTPVKPPMELRSRAQARWMVVAVAIAGMGLAFLAGRWTAHLERQSEIALKQLDLNPAMVVEPNAAPEPMGGTGTAEEKRPSVPFTSDTQKKSLADNQPKTQAPSADPVSAKRKRLSQRDRMMEQLDSVLACLEEGQQAEACCRPLLPRRAGFEYLLAEIVRTATGQRQTAAIAAMGVVGSDGTVPLLLKLSERPDLRATALQSVQRASSEQMLAALILQGADALIRKELLTELAHRKSPQAASIWLHLVRTFECRDLCLQVVDELSPELVDLLFAELDAPVIDDRLAAIQSLGSRVDQATFRRTEVLCQNFPHRWEPVAILMWNGSERAMGVLAGLQRNPERYAVIQTAAVQLEAATGGRSRPR